MPVQATGAVDPSYASTSHWGGRSIALIYTVLYIYVCIKKYMYICIPILIHMIRYIHM